MSLSFYEKNAEEYIKESISFDMTSFNSFCEKIINENNIYSVLDLGFGTGRDMLHFQKKGLNVSGIDGCSNFVKIAKQKGLNVFHEIIPDIKGIYPKYDLIYSVGVIFHLTEEEQSKLFQWIRNHLNKNGLFILSYNELNRENDSERFFTTLKKENVDKEVSLEIVSEEIMSDKRNINWITTCYRS